VFVINTLGTPPKKSFPMHTATATTRFQF